MAIVERRPLTDDTSLDVEEVQIDLWRKMTPERKADVIAGICAAVDDVAKAGIRRRHPGAGSRELFLRRAILRLGYTLAVEAFPDAVSLTA